MYWEEAQAWGEIVAKDVLASAMYGKRPCRHTVGDVRLGRCTLTTHDLRQPSAQLLRTYTLDISRGHKKKTPGTFRPNFPASSTYVPSVPKHSIPMALVRLLPTTEDFNDLPAEFLEGSKSHRIVPDPSNLRLRVVCQRPSNEPDHPILDSPGP